MKKAFTLLASVAALGTAVSAVPAAAQSGSNRDVADAITSWHEVLLDVQSVDFQEPGPEVDQVGPTRTSRAAAIVQIAVYDALNAFGSNRTSYNTIPAARPGASKEVAIAYAARDTLVHLWPDQTASIDAILAEELSKIGATGPALNRGRTVGENAAAAIIARRTGDGSEVPEATIGNGGSIATGTTNFYGVGVNTVATPPAPQWTRDPVTNTNTSLGAHWGAVDPFALITGSQFRAPPPPAAGTAAYRRDFNDVKRVGQAPNGPNGFNDEANEDTVGSTERGIFVGNYWGYDGAAKLGFPPRLYAQIAEVLAERGGIDNPTQLARFYALVHVSMADSGIAAWDSKYFYNYWRPVTGVRANDGDPATVPVAGWVPVGVSAANAPVGLAQRETPPFPAYVSGHATFGAALFETARGFMPENTAFTFVSDEYNGVTTDPFLSTVTRPLVPVRYRNLTAPALENARSRIVNGVHWQFDGDEGVKMGNSIAKFARQNLFRPAN